MDFLVLSYIMFTYDLSIPVIAAGIRKYLQVFVVIVGGKTTQSHHVLFNFKGAPCNAQHFRQMFEMTNT